MPERQETPCYQGASAAPGVRLELTTNGLTVPTRPSVWSRHVHSGAVLYGKPALVVRPVRPRAVWYGYTNGYTTGVRAIRRCDTQGCCGEDLLTQTTKA
jgi:hypothetical protein